MNKYLEEAIRIGDQLLSEKKIDKHGVFWQTTNLKKNDNEYTVVWTKNESLYSGTSGIIVFLAELYLQTKDKKYLDAAEKGMAWTFWYCKQHPTNYYALFTGRLGVSFACLKLYTITKNESYKKHALTIAKPSTKHLNDPNPVFDLINGISGSLLGLIHLHAVTKEPWVLEHIATYTQKLLDNAKLSKTGLYWDTGHTQIKPLCGFSHGSGGIGFVFLELAHYFNNPAFQYVAEQAFAYENAHFDKTMGNWPDFRLNLFEEKDIQEAEDQFRHSKQELLTTAFDANQWCHGAAGSGLARARWYELTKNKTAYTDMQKALKRTIRKDHFSFTLCHGAGGNSDLFFEIYNVIDDPKVLSYAESFGDAALEQKKQYKKYNSGMKYDMKLEPEDRSLFNGLAGVGYFLLRLHDVKHVPSVLAPKVDKTNTEKKLPSIFKISLPQIKRHILSNLFARTLEKADALAPGKVDALLKTAKTTAHELDTYTTFFTELHASLSEEKQNAFAEIFYLEHRKVTLFETSISSGITYIQNRIYLNDANNIQKLSDIALIKRSFIMSPLSELLHLSSTQTSYLLRLTPYQTDALEISAFCELVLRQFEKPQTVQACVNVLTEMYQAISKNDKALVKEKVLAQIREAIQFGILING